MALADILFVRFTDLFTQSSAGVVPVSPGGSSDFLRADGAWAVPTLTPAGVSGNIQYNNAGVLAGFGSWNGTTFDIQGQTNSIRLTSATTGNPPSINAYGGDTNVGLSIDLQGSGQFLINSGGGTVLAVDVGGGAANQISLISGQSGVGPQVSATGSDTNVGLTLKAKGAANITLQANGGIDIAIFNNPASAANFLNFSAAISGGAPTVGVFGGDTNIGLNLGTKNSGVLLLNSVQFATTPPGGTTQFLRGDGTWAAPFTAAALTEVNDTNITLTLGGSPSTALLQAASITAGWTGTLAAGRLNSNVVQSVVNDTNVTGSIATQALTLGWTGTLAAGRLNSNVVQGITNDTNVTGTISAQNLTLGWSGTLAVARGGTGGGTASGTLLDNITGFSSTGYLKRTGAGAYSFVTDPSDVTSVSNSDGTLTISPTTGAVVASLALSHANTWSGAQSFNSGKLVLNGSTSGSTTLNASATASGTLTLPAVTDTVAVLGTAQTFTSTQTFSGTLNVSGTFQSGGNAMTFPGSAATLLSTNVSQTLSVGHLFTAFSIGTQSSGTLTPAAANGNYQYVTNGGAFTLAAPSADCAIDILVTNNASAGTITFSGFTVGSNTGDALTTTNTSKFIISIRRINGTSTYVIKALQ